MSRRNEARGLLKKCFKNPIFSFVPFEIWRDVLCEGEIVVIARIAQTCWGFKELVDNLRELLLQHALKYRREDKIPIAKNLIMRCAEIGNSRAMFHIAYAYRRFGGWGLKQDEEIGVLWYKKSAMCGNSVAFAFYAYCLVNGDAVEMDVEVGNLWARKALASNNQFAIGFCHMWALATEKNRKTACEHFKISAKEGDEYWQRWLGIAYQIGNENIIFSHIPKNVYIGDGGKVDKKKAFYWYMKSAEQGLAFSQSEVGNMLKAGDGCEKNEELSKIWSKKAQNQEFDF